MFQSKFELQKVLCYDQFLQAINIIHFHKIKMLCLCNRQSMQDCIRLGENMLQNIGLGALGGDREVWPCNPPRCLPLEMFWVCTSGGRPRIL